MTSRPRVVLIAASMCACHPSGSSDHHSSPLDTAGEADGSDTDPMPTDGDASDSDDSADSGSSTGGEGDPPQWGRIDLPPLEEVNDGRFATSPACASCHTATGDATALKDEAGRDVSPFELWQATMMANASRDPFWWAMVTAEALATPSLADAIENECSKCHAPIAAARAEHWGDAPMSLDLLKTDPVRGQLGLDGVACSACHKIGDAGLDSGDQWSGNLDLRAEATIFGPHPDPFTMPMVMHTGLEPVEAPHLDRAAACSGCHTLDTTPVTSEGTPMGGHYSEQAPYLEWLNSDFSTEGPNPGSAAKSCQDCHMPSTSEGGVAISARIARRPDGGDFPPVAERSPFHRHIFLGGNTLLPAILRDNAEELQPQASAAAFDAVIERTKTQLQEHTARVSFLGSTRDGDTLLLPVQVSNSAGHKLPSGYPSRRAWLELSVRDARGTVIFRSGGVDDRGRLVDGAGTLLDSETVDGPVQTHRDQITADDQVQVYETIMGDGDGHPVFRLLRAVDDVKDNRLLPRGWSDQGPFMDRIRPVLGGTDGNFAGGSDRVTYRVSAPAAAGPYQVEVRLQYQTISARFAAELFAWEAPEIRTFERMYEQADTTPVTLAMAATAAP